MKRSTKIGFAILGLFGVMQLLQCERTNPQVSGDIAAPAPVASVLRRACYDCHSNETVWPWYSRLAPVSWLLYRDVTEGRRHLNFSEWDRVDAGRRTRKLRAVEEEIDAGDMPPWFYLPMHATARLTEADKQALKSWSAVPGG
jgi:hypothetical protein